MTKLFYFYLISVIHIFLILGWIAHGASSKAEDYKLEYIGSSFIKDGMYTRNKKFVKAEEHKNIELNVDGQTFRKDVIVFSISIESDFIRDSNRHSAFVMIVHKKKLSVDEDGNTYDKSFDKYFERACHFEYCEIGVQTTKSFDENNKLNDPDFSKAEFSFYIGFLKSEGYENFILKEIPKFDSSQNVFSIAHCPVELWVPENKMVKYVPDKNDILADVSTKDESIKLPLKLAKCHNKDGNTFLKCGRLEQTFMPSINVGYDCFIATNDLLFKLENESDREKNIKFTTNSTFICDEDDLSDPEKIIFDVIPTKNNYKTNSIIINNHNNRLMYYSGQRIHVLLLDKISKANRDCFGYYLNYEPKCIVPEINATLRLKVNDIVQGFENTVDGELGAIDTYTVDRREINDLSIGCHAVPDEMIFPQFNNFYEYRYRTSLMMVDSLTGEYKSEVNNIKSLEPNYLYECILSQDNVYPTSGKPSYIKETQFKIKLIDSSNLKWIILGVFIFISLLSTVGIIIFVKFKSKKVVPDNDTSTSTSSSMEQSSTTSSTSSTSTIIEDVVNVPILGYKPVYKTPKNIVKKVVTKNSCLNTNNNKTKIVPKKATTFKYTAKINNQVKNVPKYVPKNVPKNVVGKISNQKKIPQMEDSVFKIK